MPTINNKLAFASDYQKGAHPDILRRLAEMNMTPFTGYGQDAVCAEAKEMIRKACVHLHDIRADPFAFLQDHLFQCFHELAPKNTNIPSSDVAIICQKSEYFNEEDVPKLLNRCHLILN